MSRWLTAAVALGYLTWSAAFVHRASFLTFDRTRYFSLFDDALISMRYAWNLAHGHGLVWNLGERVEGYSNLLMTLLMAIPSIFLDPRRSALAVQLFGVITVLGVGFLCVRLARRVRKAEGSTEHAGSDAVVLAAALSYYPLSYWSLTGMETGLLALLLLGSLAAAERWAESRRGRDLALLVLAAGLLCWVRPDAVILALIVPVAAAHAARSSGPGALRVGLGIALAVLVFPLAQLLFRLAYYGSLVPNTYVLKVMGIPLGQRIANGLGYLESAAPTVLALGAVLALGLWRGRARIRWFAVGTLVVSVGFQVWAGGDPWPYWRMIAPTVPLTLALLASDLWSARLGRPVALAGLLLIVLLLNWRFLPEARLAHRPYQWEANVQNVNVALALDSVTTSSASVGVFWAGAIPFYTQRPAADFLGKSDPHVARLDPDLSGAISWAGMRSVPGHNKYDLNYSIRRLRPTYVQGFGWGRQDLAAWGASNYDSVQFRGVGLRLRHGDPRVRWARACVVSMPISP